MIVRRFETKEYLNFKFTCIGSMLTCNLWVGDVCNSDYANNIIVVLILSRFDHRLGVKQILEFKKEEDLVFEVIL